MHEIKEKLNKVDRSELLTINPNYDKLVRQYKHLNSVKMDECDTKNDLPIHLVLGIGEYARIRTRTKPLVGKEGEPIAEQTKFGWIIMSPGVEFDQSTMLLTTTSKADVERLCRLDVLVLEDTPEKDPRPVYDKFKETLTRNEEVWYETSLPWKSNHPKLPSNEQGSQRRLKNLVKCLERKEIYEVIKKGLYVDDVMTGGESVKEVTENERIKWHHVPTNENPADLGSRGGNVTNNVLWQHGPEWLSDQARWPPEVVPVVSSEAMEEEKASVRVMVAVNQPVAENVFDKLLGKYPLRKTLRICAWVNRFVRNCRNENHKRESGPIKTHEIEERTLWWIKRVQEETKYNPELSSAKLKLN
jgi:hypothetical protein